MSDCDDDSINVNSSNLLEANKAFISFNGDDPTDNKAPMETASLTTITDCPAPWLTNFSFERSESSIQNLHAECLEFCRFISPTQEELANRSKVLKEVQNVIQGAFPNTQLQYFGSQLSKTLTPSSDLDLAVLNIDVADPLSVLAEHIRTAGIATYLEVISNAKVPIIKFDHRETGISVDIVVNNNDGIVTGKLIQRYIREYPPLRPLIFVLKLFLSQRKLNDTYKGGIGSFVLSVMIVSFLQQRQKILSYQQISQASWNLGSLLMEFFRLYGISFDYEEVGISISQGGSYFQKRKREGDWWNPYRTGLLAIENPTYPEIDMGKSSFNIYRIKRSFEHAYQILKHAICRSPLPSLLSFIIRPDDSKLISRRQMLTRISPLFSGGLNDGNTRWQNGKVESAGDKDGIKAEKGRNKFRHERGALDKSSVTGKRLRSEEQLEV